MNMKNMNCSIVNQASGCGVLNTRKRQRGARNLLMWDSLLRDVISRALSTVQEDSFASSVCTRETKLASFAVSVVDYQQNKPGTIGCNARLPTQGDPPSHLASSPEDDPACVMRAPFVPFFSLGTAHSRPLLHLRSLFPPHQSRSLSASAVWDVKSD